MPRLAMVCLLLLGTLTSCWDGKDTLYALSRDHWPDRVELSDWREGLKRSLEEKLVSPPDSVVAFLGRENKRMAFPTTPRAVAISDDVRRTYVEAMRAMPPWVRHAVEGEISAVYLVEDLGSSGFAEQFSTWNGEAKTRAVFLDLKMFRDTANNWATFKERSPFVPSEDGALSVVMAYSGNDSSTTALQYLLLHEFGHIIAVTTQVLPRWNSLPPGEVAEYPFARLSWQLADDKLVSAQEADFPIRATLGFYGRGLKHENAQVPIAYEDLQQTPFPTLYASVTVDEDFADSFANYVHTEILHRPWKVILRGYGKPLRVIDSCWRQPRCAEKRAFLESLLKRLGADAPVEGTAAQAATR